MVNVSQRSFYGQEEYRVEGRVRLPASKATQLRVGMRIPVAMTHWPFGLDEWTWWRAVTVQPAPAVAGPWYDLDIELASTGDAADAPPEPPFSGSAIAALIGWQGDGNPANYGSQNFQWTGDAPGAGYSSLPTVGPLTPTAGVAGVMGISVDADMDPLRVCGEVFVAGTVSAPETITLNIRVNGVVVASDVQSISPGGIQVWNPHLLVDAGDIPVALGDVITMDTRVANDGFLAAVGDNSTVKNSSMLIVGRGTHTNIPTGSTFYYGGMPWVGP